MKQTLKSVPTHISKIVEVLITLENIIVEDVESNDMEKLETLKTKAKYYQDATDDNVANDLISKLFKEAIKFYECSVENNQLLEFTALLNIFINGMENFNIMFINNLEEYGQDAMDVNTLRLDMGTYYSSLYTYNESIKNGECDIIYANDNQQLFIDKYQDIFLEQIDYIEEKFFEIV